MNGCCNNSNGVSGAAFILVLLPVIVYSPEILPPSNFNTQLAGIVMSSVSVKSY